jgi:hypothetical protein
VAAAKLLGISIRTLRNKIHEYAERQCPNQVSIEQYPLSVMLNIRSATIPESGYSVAQARCPLGSQTIISLETLKNSCQNRGTESA